MVRSLLKWMALFLALFGAGHTVAGTDVNEATLYHLHYDLELLGTCALGSQNALRGFEAARARLTEGQDAVPLAHEEAIRSRAWVDVHREWGNRGLGGFRNWCRTDGAAALARLEALAVGDL